MKKLVIGILAHVDAGKTTLSESMLYTSGSIRHLGRVDNKDAYLDNNAMERERGITIFSKQAEFSWKDMAITLLDTPGHVDFSAEMERTLKVLDYAVLVISGADGVQGHTRTLWRLLKLYQVPVFLFINKMDQPGADKEALLWEIKEHLDSNCIDFTQEQNEGFYEEAAMCEEAAMEKFLSEGSLASNDLAQMITKRELFPCYFGSALKVQGVEELLDGLYEYGRTPQYPDKFGAKIFKIAREEQGNRLTYLKVTGGTLRVKDMLNGKAGEEEWAEKVNQIRIYSGEKYEAVSEAAAGTVCAVTGLTKTYPGEGLGIEEESILPVLEPVRSVKLVLPKEVPVAVMLPKLKQLEEENPELHIVYREETGEILIKLMGEVQLEILQKLVKERYGVVVEFGEEKIIYKETICNTVEGVGHFEPLRHYAEVHLLLEPGERGSGLCSEGGDFRQATYRAIRQGLMEADSVLLEPYYAFRLEIPEECLGRAMHDMEQRNSRMDAPQIENGMALLTGSGPVSKLSDYQKELNTYAKGRGKFFCTLQGYEVCQNQDEVVEAISYQPEADLYNTSDSVFCAHGAGYLVPWYEVKEHMHMPSVLEEDGGGKEERIKVHRPGVVEDWVDTDEIDAILEKTFYANRQEGKRKNGVVRKHKAENSTPTVRTYRKPEKLDRYLLVDGYNVIYAWKDLHELAEVNLDGARGKLQDILCNYQGIFGGEVIVVFDAYRLTGHKTEQLDYHNIHIVFTKEAETADQYIERFAHEHHNHYDVTVATSDGLEQMIIRGQDCKLISAREFEQEVKRANSAMWDNYRNGQNIF
ncbi:NYN domain-containing protein [Thermoguttaceae bacterium LCP21S3_D4]